MGVETGLKQKLAENKVVLIIIPNQIYNKSLPKLVKRVAERKVCLVSFNKSCAFLAEKLKEENIKVENVFFIDCVTKTITKTKKEPNCIFVSSPNALTEISLNISKFSRMPSMTILIDSLSNLLIYHDFKTVIKFVQFTVNNARNKENLILIMAMPEGEKVTKLFNHLQLECDEVVEFKG